MRTLHDRLSGFAASRQTTSKSASAIGVLLLTAALAPAQELITRVSVNPHWHPTNGDSVAYPAQGSLPSFSADGKWIVFDSLASNMTTQDFVYDYSDVFVEEVATGRIVNLTYYALYGGLWTNGACYAPSISANGRFVAFTSDATNLDPNTTDTNGCSDVYVCDRDPDGNGILDEYFPTFVRVSLDEYGGEAWGRCWLPTISADGMRVLFLSDADNLDYTDSNNATDAFLRDLANGTTERVDIPDSSTGDVEADYGCGSCDLSADGWTVAFDSWSDNLVRGDTNGVDDVFIRSLGGGVTSRVSVSTYGYFEGDGSSLIRPHCLSSDGMVVAFSSFADNLDATDANPGWDVFVHNRWSGVTSLVSVDSNGASADGDCGSASISADGNYVAFSSVADNLVGGDGNGLSDVFVRNLPYSATTLVSASVNGGTAGGTSQLATISSDGASVAFASDAADLDPQGDAAGFRDVFFHEFLSGAMRCVTGLPPGEANSDSGNWGAAVSDDGRYVAFNSWATNLVAGDNNRSSDIFVADRFTGAIVRVSVSSSGEEANDDSSAPSISADGRFVAFASRASNLVVPDTNVWTDVFRHDRDPDGNGIFDEGNGVTILVSVNSSGVQGNDDSYQPAISGDGNRIAFGSNSINLDARDTYWLDDIYLRDVAAGTTELISVSHDGLTGGDDRSDWPSISANGESVAFTSWASNLLGTLPPSWANNSVYVRDLPTGLTQDVSWSSPSVSSVWSDVHSISGDGNRIVFSGQADDGGTTVAASWVFDRAASKTTLLSVNELGGYGHAGTCWGANISTDGRHAVFTSNARDLVADDTNGWDDDVFLRDIDEGRTTLVSRDGDGAPANSYSFRSAISEGGDIVVFDSWATNLVDGDTNGQRDVFLYNRYYVARWNNYGTGFPGTLGIPGLTLDAEPVLGATVTMTLGNSLGAPTVALLFLSFRQASIDLGYGAWLLIDIPASLRFIVPVDPSGLALPGDIPDDPTISGLSIYLQCLELDPGAFKKLSFTPGMELHFGR